MDKHTIVLKFLEIYAIDYDGESIDQVKKKTIKGGREGKKSKTRKTKERTRCQLRILIAAKQPSAKLQSAKSTEDENSEGKTNDSELRKCPGFISVCFRSLSGESPSPLALSLPRMLLYLPLICWLTKRLVAEC